MEQDEIRVEVDFTSLANRGDKEEVDDVIRVAEAQLPRLVDDASVQHITGKAEGKLGIELLPIIELVATAPAILLLLRELGRIVREKIKTKSDVTLRKKSKDGSTKEVTIDTTEMSGSELERTLKTFLLSG